MNEHFVKKGGMFYGATANTFEKAYELRQNLTKTETLLWNELKASKLGVRFKSQHPIDIYIVDFYCHSKMVVVEIDGGYHLNPEVKERDEGRQYDIEQFGIKFLRLTNDEIEKDLNRCVERIKLICY